MNEISCFLNSNPEIKNVALLVGDKYTYENLREFVKDISIDHLVVINPFPDSKTREIREQIEYDRNYMSFSIPKLIEFIDINEFNGMDGTWALFAEWIEADLLLNVNKWKPAYLLADLWKDYITAFKVWEAYKNSAVHILIKTRRWGKADQILEWDSSESGDVELSVIFPMYNVEKYLDQCIESVTAWKAPYVEFLFVNDGSPDNSREVVLKWAKEDPRIKLLDKPNGGCASARQYGLDHAKGKYIGFIDPDDYIDESMYRKLLRAAMTGSYDISYCGYNEYYEDTKTQKRVDDALGVPYCDGTTNTQEILNLITYCRVAIWRGIYKAEMLKKNNIHFYTDLRRFDDLPFKVETFAVAKSVIAVPEHLYYYRLARPGQDVAADDERLYVHFDIFKYLNKSIADQNNGFLTDQLQMCKIQTHLHALRKIKDEFKEYYIKHAKEDLDSTGTFERTYELARERIGQENADYYKAIKQNNVKIFSNYK
ncbi:glycosyltransferase group 2 family [Clostridium sp. CAG:81]|nr:glycosyltransferase group 2 family [Clostridium sp. CAG:81]